MCKDKEGQYLGIMAALRWVFGTNAEMKTLDARREAERQVLPESGDPFERALQSIRTAEDSAQKLNAIIGPSPLDNAIDDILVSHQQGGRRA